MTRRLSNKSRAARVTRREALGAGALAVLGLGAARATPVKPAMTLSLMSPDSKEPDQVTFRLAAAKNNPKLIGFMLYDLTRKGKEKKPIRQVICKGHMQPGEHFFVTFRHSPACEKTLTVRVLAWDKEYPPGENEDISKFLLVLSKSATTA